MTPGAKELTAAEQDSVFRPVQTAAVAVQEIARGLRAAGHEPAVTPVGTSVEETTVSGAAMAPQAIGPGDLYVAVSGARAHGADFVAEAVARGAVAVLTDVAGVEKVRAALGYGIPVIEVERVREAAGPAAALIYRNDEASGPALFGVTGTNGKTTTTYFLRALLSELIAPRNESAGLIGTIEISAGQRRIPAKMTTPEAVQLHGLMALFRERGVSAAAMEVSSHAISYRRIAGLYFDVAGFTNLTQDHLDLHGSMEEYFDAKAELFGRSRTRVSVVTVDDSWGYRMAAAATGEVVTLATQGQPAEVDWEVLDVVPEGLGSAFTLHHLRSGERIRTRVGLPGDFNVSNAALAAVMILHSSAAQSQRQEIVRILEEEDPFSVSVPGRMQVIATSPAAIVDFAHNPDAMIRTLEAAARARAHDENGDPTGRIVLVIGAAGDRDRSKRPTMGAIAVRMADHVIISDDDPHGEDPSRIRRELMEGGREAIASGGLTTQLEEISPREEAIERAVSLATAADTVLIAGRGHEVHQDFAGVHHPIDDRAELAAALRRHGFTPQELHDTTIEATGGTQGDTAQGETAQAGAAQTGAAHADTAQVAAGDEPERTP
ncbi:MAG TPA: UDP-N-acetylmuramoyl-L-alanyl-D-glutamate--2,6-diaminopimelate ligase [Candidatus Nesterenkonia stercoripullorum]|uniref:UDP-N-acetylmuramyl-tripeptide synthetase n=1 Tax=Candidatus Nesterenkonia stercoripullorum TaxID=2838701 RepID=A0A9D1USQ3_9MICC|nr:UDP-N-acetylmuramoyl-L-alanyl-D-glutamate--2,6-diaminopimelate ligase [Candidatus Nesterenkonia stercoripullorum]